MLADVARLRLLDNAGQSVPIQTKCLDRWPDGSVRWAFLNWLADVDGETRYRVAPGDPVPAPILPKPVLPPLSLDITIGTQRAVIQPVFVFDDGPIIRSAYSSGHANVAGNQIRWAITVDAVASMPIARVAITLHNEQAAVHPGGCWDLGDPRSIILDDASIHIRWPHNEPATGIRCSREFGRPFETFRQALELYQDSSGGDNWQSHNHLNRHRHVPCRFRGYRLVADGGDDSGQRATPIISIERDRQCLAASVPLFWQNFPKAIEADTNGITIRLFPRQSADGHELQPGEQKTHIFHVAFAPDDITPEPLDWTRSPIQLHVAPDWIEATNAVPFLTSIANDPHRTYGQLVDAAIAGDDTFQRKREVIDEYGWRHFGDMWADHEAYLHPEHGPIPRASHYNNQYDAVAGGAYQFLRTGDHRWFELMDTLARHVIDIDIYHTREDRALYSGGMFWHTFHYVDADTATHRAYPAKSVIPSSGRPVPGGGPSSEHVYTTGLMLHHFLTGDPASRQAVLGLAEWVIQIDDGNLTPFRWLCRGDTGWASCSGSTLYNGPGRGPGNAINALLDAHRLSGDAKYLNKAEQLIRRCTHPKQDIASLRLDHIETRWYYTVYLQAIGKYLDYKIDIGQLDGMYAYGQAVLLHFARWMNDHERPYLDQRDKLEYPTETWPAQDMRKCEVFQYAYRHATGAERERFRERAAFYFKHSTETLGSMATRTYCRPVVLMMSYGWSHAWFKRNPNATAPAASADDFGEPATFIPQKVIAIRRFKRLMVAGAIVGATALAALIVELIR
jgi:hypothetical protein